MNEVELELANGCYGYGRWKAPYWFIGLEEGQAPWENSDFTRRAKVFGAMNQEGLCDCLRFHRGIGEYRWHQINPKRGKVDLQSTWKYLMLLLKAFHGETIEAKQLLDVLGDYQCDRWGAKDEKSGETCVIELSGLPANNTKVSKTRPPHIQEKLAEIRSTRIKHIKAAIVEHHPEFVVMYGLTAKEHWLEIAPKLQAGVPRKIGRTTFLIAQHPTSHYKRGQVKDQYWMDLGKKLSAESEQP